MKQKIYYRYTITEGTGVNSKYLRGGKYDVSIEDSDYETLKSGIVGFLTGRKIVGGCIEQGSLFTEGTLLHEGDLNTETNDEYMSYHVVFEGFSEAELKEIAREVSA